MLETVRIAANLLLPQLLILHKILLIQNPLVQEHRFTSLFKASVFVEVFTSWFPLSIFKVRKLVDVFLLVALSKLVVCHEVAVLLIEKLKQVLFALELHVDDLGNQFFKFFFLNGDDPFAAITGFLEFLLLLLELFLQCFSIGFLILLVSHVFFEIKLLAHLQKFLKLFLLCKLFLRLPHFFD